MKEKLEKIIYEIIDELNPLLEEKEKLKKHDNEIIFGDSSKLDSLGKVNFIVIFEEKINNELSIEDFSLIDLMTNHDSESIGELVQLINNYLNDN